MQYNQILKKLKPSFAFTAREFALWKKYFSWVLVDVISSITQGMTVILIGVTYSDMPQTFNLLLGVVIWNYISKLFCEIATNVGFERWEGTIEYTFMAPITSFSHLMGIVTWGTLRGLLQLILIAFFMLLIVDVDISQCNFFGFFVVLLVASLSFIGLGMLATILPIISTENGVQGVHILQGFLLLISGIYYPVEVLPSWLRIISYLSPVTYTLSALRKMLGLTMENNSFVLNKGLPLSSIYEELAILTLLGIVMLPLGLKIFNMAVIYAKERGLLSRTG